MELRIKIVSRIEDLLSQEWNSVFPKVLENYNFFKTLDESSFEQFKFFYILVYQGDVPIGAATCFLMDFPLDISVAGPLKKLTDGIKKILPGLINPKVVVCGMPMGCGRIGISRFSPEVIEIIQQGLEKIANDHKAPMILFKDFTESYQNVLDRKSTRLNSSH